MVKKFSIISQLTPSRLVDPAERKPVPDEKPQAKHFRFFYVIFRFAGLFGGNAWLRLRGEKNAALRQERILKCLQRLGMLWIRAAQALMIRSKKLSTPFGLRLLDLRDKSGACDFERVRKVVNEELEQPLEEVFDRFEERPFSATTASQLHRARLRKEQIWVAVKIQQPDAADIFQRDLTIFRRVIRLMKLLSIQEGMRWDYLCHELEEIKNRELNYQFEAAALDILRKNLIVKPMHVPRLFRRYCKKRMLVMEFIRGALLSDLIALRQTDPERAKAWLQENNVDPEIVARRLFHAVYRQVFENNFFHGDLHTGNIILLRDSNIAVIECRSAGSLETESLKKQKVFLNALAQGEYITAGEIYFLLATRLPRVNLNSVKEKLVRIWRVWETRVHVETLPYEEKSLTYMTAQVNRVVHEYRFSALWSFSKLNCAWVHLDNALSFLSPDLNYLKHLRLYFREESMRETADNIRNLPSRMASAVVAMHEMPERMSEFMVFREAMMRRQAQVVQGSASKMDAFVSTGFAFASFFLLILIFFLLSAFFIQFRVAPIESLLGPQLYWLATRIPRMSPGIWLITFAGFILAYGFFRTQKRRFSRQEFGKPANNTAVET
jgi:ubiquinone biosynthesis protein